jgi:hypothetical protein
MPNMTDPTLASLPILLLKGIFTEFLKLWWCFVINVLGLIKNNKNKNL